MSAGKYNLYIEQGTDFAQPLTVTIPGLSNLSGCSAVAQIRATAASASVSASFAIAISGSTITMSLSAADTAGIKAGSYVYDVKLTKPDTTVVRLIEGTATVSAQVTR